MTTGAEWIERYVNAVGRQLPPKERADVELELRFLIQDELDPGDFQFADEAQVLAVLARFGRPETVAARYRAPRYLIGPRLFPVFRSVLGIVVAVSLALSLFGAIVTANVTQAPLNLMDAVGHIWAGLLQEVAIVVLVFAVIEAFAARRAAQQGETMEPAHPAARQGSGPGAPRSHDRRHRLHCGRDPHL